MPKDLTKDFIINVLGIRNSIFFEVRLLNERVSIYLRKYYIESIKRTRLNSTVILYEE